VPVVTTNKNTLVVDGLGSPASESDDLPPLSTAKRVPLVPSVVDVTTPTATNPEHQLEVHNRIREIERTYNLPFTKAQLP
jgi:hypothetical protein